MSATAPALGAGALLETAPPAPPPSPTGPWPALAALLCGFLLAATLALGLAQILIERRQVDLEGDLHLRLDALALGSAEVMATWRDGALRLGERLADFPLLRLFVAEAGHGQPGPDAVERDGGDIARDLQDELPYMQGLIDDFARRSRLLGVYVVDPRGVCCSATPAARCCPTCCDGTPSPGWRKPERRSCCRRVSWPAISWPTSCCRSRPRRATCRTTVDWWVPSS